MSLIQAPAKAESLPVPKEILKEAEYLAKHFNVEIPEIILQTALTPTYFPPKYTSSGRPLLLLHPKAKDPLMKLLYHEFKHYLQLGERSGFELSDEEVKRCEDEAEEFAEKWYQERGRLIEGNPDKDAFTKMIKRDIETAERGRKSALEEIERIKAEFELSGRRIPMSVQDRINTLEDSVKFYESEIKRLRAKLGDINPDDAKQTWLGEPGGKIPSQKEIYDCLKMYEEHKRMLTEREPSALRLQRILEACYPGDQDKQEDLWCALVMDIGTGFAPIGKIMRAFKRWDVEEAYDCIELKDLFREPEVRWMKVEESKGSENTFNGISREGYYLNFNKDEIFKALIASEGHFRNISGKDKAGFLNCVVKHLADAEGHCDEAISHALIAENEESSRSFLELRDTIRDFRRYIQSSPITRDEGIREIRKIRRRFEAFNPDYDVSKCETCGDPSEVMEEINKILNEMNKTPLAVAAHEHNDLLLMEREMAEKLIAKLSEKYGVEPPELEISDKCHEPQAGLYSVGKIMLCQSGVNLHVLAHEFWHHVQNEKGLHMDEGDAECFAVELFKPQIEKGLYALHGKSHSEGKMVKTIKDVAVVYGGQHIGQGIERAMIWADTQMPGGVMGIPLSLITDIIGTIGGIAGALYLGDPWDMLMALIGGHLSTDLWRHAEAMIAPGLPLALPPLATPSAGLYTVKPQTPLPSPKGRYTITG